MTLLLYAIFALLILALVIWAIREMPMIPQPVKQVLIVIAILLTIMALLYFAPFRFAR